MSSSNSYVISDLSVFLEPLVSSSRWKSTTMEEPLMEKPTWTVRCLWFPLWCCFFSPRPGWWQECDGDYRLCRHPKRDVCREEELGCDRTEPGCRVGWCRRELQTAQNRGCNREQWKKAEHSQPQLPSSVISRIYLLMQTYLWLPVALSVVFYPLRTFQAKAGAINSGHFRKQWW